MYVFVQIMDTTLSSAATTTMVMDVSGGMDVGIVPGGGGGGGDTGATHAHADQHQHGSSFIAGPGPTACTDSSPSQPQRWTEEQSRLLRKLVEHPENGGKDWTNIAKKVRASKKKSYQEKNKKKKRGSWMNPLSALMYMPQFCSVVVVIVVHGDDDESMLMLGWNTHKEHGTQG